jgi:hypothetical protein
VPPRPTKQFNDPNVINPGLPQEIYNPQFSGEQFDQLIRDRGLRWIHEKAALCPNVRDINSKTHDPNCKLCHNGFLYFGKEEVFGIFQSNKLEKIYEVQGTWSIGEAVVTFTSYAINSDGTQGKMVDFMHQDRVTCLDYTFTWSEVVEHSPLGVDRLQYPAVTIEFLTDKDGNQYRMDVDFKINLVGMIEWTGKNRPKADLSLGRGGIYTVVYTANPQFYVVSILHELRATKGLDKASGKVTALRLPQQCYIKRTYLVDHPGDNVGQSSALYPRNGQIAPG